MNFERYLICMLNYNHLVRDIENLLEQGRKQTLQSVNNILVMTYWQIGRYIVRYQQSGKERANYGARLIDKLSEDLTNRLGRGFSRDNLENMRKLYLIFPNSEAVPRKSSWYNLCTIMRLEEDLARRFYIIESEKLGWSGRELRRQINSLLFERLALSRNKSGVLELAKKGEIVETPRDAIKDPYVLEFLGLGDFNKYSESELEQKIIGNLKSFILELGNGFMFVERQKRITLDNEHFFADLVFYNRFLKCFVIFELKLGKLTHKDLGQLQMYVNYYDIEIKQEGENSTIGVLLCSDKKETIVKYSLPKDNKTIFASQYKVILPDKEKLKREFQRLVLQ